MTAPTQESAKPLGPFKWAMGFIGTLASASAVISLVQHWGDIELAPLPALYVTYYRVLMRALVDWIPLPFHWRIPQWYLDALAVNGIVAGAAARALVTVKYHQVRLFVTLLSGAAFLLVAWLVGPLLIGFVSRFSRSTIDEAEARIAKWAGNASPAIAKQIEQDQLLVERYTRFLAIRKRFAIGMALVILATGVFFLLNGVPQAQAVHP